MVNVTQIKALIHTGSHEFDGDVYLCVGGREFHVESSDTEYNDFRSNSSYTYVFGTEANVAYAANNNPQVNLFMSIDDVRKNPIYIRVGNAADKKWSFNGAVIDVIFGLKQVYSVSAISESQTLVMGDNYGNIYHIPH